MISWYTRYLRKCILFTIIPFEFFQWTGVGLNGQNGECATNRATQARRHACATATIQLQSLEVINVWGYGLSTWNVTTILVKVWFNLSIFSHKKKICVELPLNVLSWDNRENFMQWWISYLLMSIVNCFIMIHMFSCQFSLFGWTLLLQSYAIQ